MKNKFFIFGLIFLIPFTWNSHCYAQQGNLHIRNGNKAYANQDYSKASDEYQKALNDKSNELKAKFNMGDAYYRQGKHDSAYYNQAIDQYKSALSMTQDKILTAHAEHNIGNSYLAQGKFDESIKAYKEALRNNCTDDDTRYNLAYAEAMQNQKKQQKQQPKQGNSQPQQAKPQQAQPKQDDINKQNAQRILDALDNDEKNNHKPPQPAGKKQIEKDW